MNDIFSKKHLDHILKIAKQIKKTESEVCPVIFFTADKTSEKIGMTPIELDNPDYWAKSSKFATLGALLRKNFGQIHEVLFVTDAFYLEVPKSKKNKKIEFEMAVRDNPKRKEALFIIGRDSQNEKQINIAQPYHFKGKKLIFDKPISAISKGKTIKTQDSILDFLFKSELDETILKAQNINPDTIKKEIITGNYGEN